MMKIFLILFCVLVLMPSPSVRAETIEIEAIETGWWSDVHDYNYSQNTNYMTGWKVTFNQGTGVLYSGEMRSFFSFDLSNVTGAIYSAKLEIQFYTAKSYDPKEIIGLYDVSTIGSDLWDTHGTNDGIFYDLGGGTTYGTYEVGTAYDGSSELAEFALNTEAIMDINAALGGMFSIGGRLLSIDYNRGADEWIFGESSGYGVQRLVFDTTPPEVPVSEPTTMILLGTGLISLAGARRKYIK